MSEPAQPRRKRKWDVETPEPSSSSSSSSSSATNNSHSSSHSNFQDHQYHTQPSSSLNSQARSASPPSEQFSEDVEINDMRNRHLVLRQQIQEMVSKETGVSIAVRGIYLPNKEYNPNNERPLHFHITASTKSSLNAGVAKIKEIIDQAANAKPGQNPFGPPSSSGPPTYLIDKVPVDIEGDRFFVLKPRLIGPGGSFVKHIQVTSGARVQLRGVGSGYIDSTTQKESSEPLHFYISASNQEILEKAKELCGDLIKTVKDDKEKYDQESVRRRQQQQARQQSYQNYQQPAQQAGYGYGYPAYPGYAASYPPPPPGTYPPGTYPPGTYPPAQSYPSTAYPATAEGYNAYAAYGYNPYNPYNPYSAYGNYAQPGQADPNAPPPPPGDTSQTSASHNSTDSGKSYSSVPPPPDHYGKSEDPLTAGFKGSSEDYSNVPPPDYNNPEDPAKKRKL